VTGVIRELLVSDGGKVVANTELCRIDPSGDSPKQEPTAQAEPPTARTEAPSPPQATQEPEPVRETPIPTEPPPVPPLPGKEDDLHDNHIVLD